jgi:hypothetical protein
MYQAWWLSVLYLASGVVITLLRQHTQSEFWFKASLVQDGVARNILQLLHLWEPVARGYAGGFIPGWLARCILGAVTVGLIFTQAFALGVVLTGIRALYLRLARAQV